MYVYSKPNRKPKVDASTLATFSVTQYNIPQVIDENGLVSGESGMENNYVLGGMVSAETGEPVVTWDTGCDSTYLGDSSNFRWMKSGGTSTGALVSLLLRYPPITDDTFHIVPFRTCRTILVPCHSSRCTTALRFSDGSHCQSVEY